MDPNSVEISLAQKIFIVKCYYRCGDNAKSIESVGDELKREYQIRLTDNSVVNDIVLAFETYGSVADSEYYYTVPAEPGSPDSFWGEEVIHDDQVIVEVFGDGVQLDEPVEVQHEPMTVFEEHIEEPEDLPLPRAPHRSKKPIVTAAQRLISCKECHQEFSTNDQLATHKLTHKTETWTCDICGKVSLQKRIHKMHLLVHSDLKPHACGECPMRFVRLQGLKRHLLTHTGEKPYACKYCGQRFAAFMSHQMHVRLHTGERPCECKHCGEKFIGLPALNTHLKSHLGEYQFRCTECSARFKTEKAKLDHIVKKHNDVQWIEGEEMSL